MKKLPRKSAWILTGLCAIAVCVASVLHVDAQQSVEKKSPPNIKVTILGSGHPKIESWNPRMQQGIVVEVGETRWLIDAGAGVLGQMYHMGFPPESIDKMFITHLHVDHCFDVGSVLFCRYFAPSAPGKPSGEKAQAPARKPLAVYGPDGIQDMIEALYKQAYKVDGRGERQVLADDTLTIQKISEHREIVGDGWKVSTARVSHAPMDCWGFRLDSSGKSVVVAGDVGGPNYPNVEDNQPLIELSKDTDLFVVDGLHLSPQTLAEMVKRIAPKKVLVTHISELPLASNKLYNIEKFPEELSKVCSGEIIVAVDGTNVGV